ncbi:tautomerase family protein [Streptomyces antarcticus]|uniref:tautomerase family protein n=1 Tax=Streptomyces antarcticus TaxID=2996458 RepID=UPI0022713D18|nr:MULTISPECIES: 4-oxalocrotonate tautomerase family protein [unclassified Streptomyces]MCY0942972.1 4-oxalocrotonate tautomerase family protein [Streptomyces sp. H34-AA3]MCY0952981.1 4-oxalocrotonate tautomerase family protein [Streptomyces sp. H27-S2]MCZ4083068.1 4-oxalocrotonate tautomerase family protein [Streptomyces sp. H34-S5]
MPVITVNWWEGNDRAARSELVAGITDVVTRVSGCPQESVTVIVRDVEPGHWGSGGRLADERAPRGPRTPR